MTTAPPSIGVPRFPALDGLRGVAAVVVLLHHVAFAMPWFAPTYFSDEIPPVDSIAWWLAYTPLKLLTAGPEAVIVFFLLSGFVLALEPLAKRRFDWIAYYPRRIVRLYLPIIASVLLAVGLLLWVPRTAASVSGTWLEVLADPTVTFGSIVRESTVLFEPEFRINAPLWSLVWEVWFSLLLPLFIAAVVLLRRAWWAGVLVGFATSMIGMQVNTPAVVYLPMFLIGVSLASGASELAAFAARVRARRGGLVLWWMLLVVALVLLIVTWMLRGAGLIDVVAAASVAPTTLLGATLLVVCCAFWPGGATVLETRPAAWLGRVSYSLYLVHVPVLLAIAFALGDDQWGWIAVTAIPAAVLVAWGFARVVELPAHRLARWVGRRTADAREATAAARG